METAIEFLQSIDIILIVTHIVFCLGFMAFGIIIWDMYSEDADKRD